MVSAPNAYVKGLVTGVYRIATITVFRTSLRCPKECALGGVIYHCVEWHTTELRVTHRPMDAPAYGLEIVAKDGLRESRARAFLFRAHVH